MSGGRSTTVTGATYNRNVTHNTRVHHFNRPWSRSYGTWYHGGWRNWERYPPTWAGLGSYATLTPWASGRVDP